MKLHLIFHFHTVVTDTLNVLIFFSAAMYFKPQKNTAALMVVQPYLKVTSKELSKQREEFVHQFLVRALLLG